MDGSAFFNAIRFYLRALTLILAAFGLAALAALQVGWIGAPANALLETTPAEIDTGDTIALTGTASLHSFVIPVDPSLVYDLSAEVRTFAAEADEIAPARVYLGVETLDANQQPLQSGSSRGPRYGGARNYQLRPVQGWVTIEGAMTGEGDEGHHQFRPGTRYVRVVAILNRGGEGKTTEIRKVRFAPRLALEAL